MNKYRNNGLDNVSAGRFIERGYKGADIAKLKTLSNAVIGEQTGNNITIIKNMTSDFILNPDEKRNLKQEWDYITASFLAATNTAEKLGVLNDPEYVKYKEAYDKLDAKLKPIFADMNVPSEIDSSFDLALTEYYDSANTFNIYISLLRNDIIKQLYGVSLVVVTDSPVYEPADTMTFHALIYTYERGGRLKPISVEIKNLYKDKDGNYPDLYQWTVSGTKNDEKYMADFLGKEYLVIPASDVANGKATVSFKSTMVVG